MNRPQRVYRLIGMYLLFYLSACTETTPGYFPFDPGMSWQYNAVMATMDATEKQKYLITNMPQKSIAGKQVFVQKTLTGSEYIYAEDDSGVFQLGLIRGDDPEQSFIPEKHYLLKYPLSPGTIWQDSVKTVALRKGGPRGVIIIEDVPVQAKLVAVNDKVRVVAGSFSNCLRIERTGEVTIPLGRYQYVHQTVVSVKDVKWYALGVGLVKSVRTETTQSRVVDHGEYQMELYAFKNK